MDFIQNWLAGNLLEWFLASPWGVLFLTFVVTVISILTPLQLFLRGLKVLTRLTTKTEVDDLWVGRGQVVADRVMKAARAILTTDPDMLKRITGIWKPIPRSKALNFQGGDTPP